jgi:hypothetical protein
LPSTVNIYCLEHSARHNYIFSVIFNQLLGIDYRIVSIAEEAHINYSHTYMDTLTCVPYGLLAQNNITKDAQADIEFSKWEDTNCFYKTGDGALPFDLFAASFFLLSRYEEWLPYQTDAHLRFPAEASVLYQNQLLEEPLINQWAIALRNILIAAYPNLIFEPRKFSFLSTIDIDMAWKYKHKGITRHIFGITKDLLSGKWQDLMDRFQIVLGQKEDPFDNFEWQREFHLKNQVECAYFVLLGDHATYDKNTRYSHPKLRQLVRKLSGFPNTSLGIHPSYASNFNTAKVAKEVARLDEMLSKKTTASRQHFLMHRMPVTYKALLDIGIKTDYTMGYSTHLGFRAGIAAPFYWFDLEKNEVTELLLVPFCAMDITPLHYYGQSMDQAITTLCRLVDNVKSVDGQYASLWHNDSLSEQDRWRGWRKVYEEVVYYIKQ